MGSPRAHLHVWKILLTEKMFVLTGPHLEIQVWSKIHGGAGENAGLIFDSSWSLAPESPQIGHLRLFVFGELDWEGFEEGNFFFFWWQGSIDG